MVKIKTIVDGRVVLLLGLSHANLDDLRATGLNGCVKVADPELEMPFEIWITAAETEQVMLQSFATGIKEGTKLRIDRRFKS